MTRAQLLQATRRALTLHGLAPDENGVGRGWAANRAYVLTHAATIATADRGVRTPYIKTADGYCVGIYSTNGTVPGFGSNWVGIFLASTDPVAAGMELHTERGWYTCPLFPFEYLGLDWYFSCFNQNSTWSGANSLNTALPVFDSSGKITGYATWGVPPPTSTVIAMLEAAGVRKIPKYADRPVLTGGAR